MVAYRSAFEGEESATVLYSGCYTLSSLSSAIPFLWKGMYIKNTFHFL